jgi:hypothetical protein
MASPCELCLSGPGPVDQHWKARHTVGTDGQVEMGAFLP